MTSEGSVHDSDLDYSDDDDDASMATEHNYQKSLCCGFFASRTCTLRGNYENLSQIITVALTSSDCLDSFDMPSIQELLACRFCRCEF